jgi:hypothetical protein
MSNFSGVRVARSLVLCVCFVDRCLSFCPFSIGHCVVCPLRILITLWYLQIQSLLKPLIVDLHTNNIKWLTSKWHILKIIEITLFIFDGYDTIDYLYITTLKWSPHLFYVDIVDYNTYRQWIINMCYICLLSYYVHWLWNQSHHT